MSGSGFAFERVRVVAAPGFEQEGFSVDGLSPGLNVVHGPNGVGKSTLRRAMGLLLRNADTADGYAGAVHVSGVARVAGTPRAATRRPGQKGPQWEGGDPPRLPELASCYHLPLDELLQTDADDVAQRIARLAAGNCSLARADLKRAGIEPRKGGRTSGAARKELAAALRALEQARQQQPQPQNLESRQHSLETRIAAAQRAAAEARVLEGLLALRAAAREHERAGAAVAGFDPLVARLDGSELKRLGDLDAAVEDDAARLRDEQDALAEAPAGCTPTDLPPDGLPARVRDTLDQQRDAVQRQAEQVAAAAAALGRAEAMEAGARGRLAQHGQPAPEREQIGDLLANLPDLVEWLRHDLDRANLAAALRSLNRLYESTPPQALPYPVAVSALWGWLEAGARASVAGVVLLAALAGGLLLGAGGVGLATVGAQSAQGWVWPMALSLGALALLAALVLRAGARRRAVERRAFDDAAPLTPPVEWTTPAVLDRLRELRAEQAEAELAQARHGQWLARAGEREELANRERQVQATAADLRRRFGAVAILDDPLAATPWIQALQGWRDAAATVDEAREALAQADSALAGELGRLATALAPYGYGTLPATDPVTAASAAAAAVAHLQRRGEMQRLRTRIDSRTRQCAELLARLALPDDEAGRRALREAMEQRPAYTDARDALKAAEGALSNARAALQDGDSWPDEDEAALRERLQTVTEAVAEGSVATQELGAIHERVRQAKQATRVADGEAAVDRLRDRVLDEREADYAAVVMHHLIDHIRGRHEAEEQPQVLAAANRRFAQWTRNAYRLRVRSGDEGARFAVEDRRTGAERALDELSSGTRVQLLMAVRTAYIEHQEDGGTRLPLWLDEALATSDHGRIRAIAEVVDALLKEGRQLFYFTAQPDDVDKWRHLLGDGRVHEVDLAAARRAAGPPRIEVPLRLEPAVPAPDGLDHAAYGERLGVPGLDPWSPDAVGDADLWYLVPSAPALHTLRQRDYVCWRDLQAHLDDPRLDLPEELRQIAAARARALEIALELWRQGRARPVAEAVLQHEDCPLTDTFAERVLALVAPCEGDGVRLVAAMRALPRVRETMCDRVEEYLRETGHLPAGGEPPRDAAEIRREVGLRMGDALDASEIGWLVAHLPGLAVEAAPA